MLEKMAEFFEARLDGYDLHMLTEIEGAGEFYPYTARQLPTSDRSCVLDLGCGTGLELEEYYKLCPSARVTGVDMSRGMLAALRAKFEEKDIELICASYFECEFGCEVYDAAVSVESLHHFTREEKIPLYEKVCRSLKRGGCFIITDYFATGDSEEIEHRRAYLRLREEQGIVDSQFYHYDTPLTTEHEIAALLDGGFSSVTVLNNWANTYTIKAVK